jgi:hypothetical protein
MYFAEMVRRLQERGSHVIVVALPIAPPIYGAFDLEFGHRYIVEVGAELSEIGDEFYDLQDPRVIGATACEFADVHHAGNTAYMKLLALIVTENPTSRLADYIDLDYLEALIAANPDRTIVQFGTEVELPPEHDFLRLGCNKS